MDCFDYEMAQTRAIRWNATAGRSKWWIFIPEMVVLLAFAPFLFSDEVRITTIPQNFVMASADTAVRITVTVEPHPDNREILIYWAQQGGEEDSTRIQLDQGSPRQFQRVAKRLRPGILYIRATLERAGSIHMRFKEMEVK